MGGDKGHEGSEEKLYCQVSVSAISLVYSAISLVYSAVSSVYSAVSSVYSVVNSGCY